MREKVNPSYPELTRILNRYRNGRRIIWDDIPEINKELSANIKKDYYFKVCYSCVVMFKKTIEDTFTDSRVGFENLLDRRELLFESFGQSYELLVVLIAGLAWEEKTQDTDYYDEEYFIEKYRNKFYELKRANKKAVIAASSGMECNLKKDSIIEQMFFCMETYGEEYSIVG